MKSNVFLLLFLLCGLVFNACSKSETTPVQARTDLVKYAQGVVKKTDGTPIPGVAVTDGIQVVYTDNMGGYQMHLDSLSRFVYISIPAGYNFDRLGSQVNFYAKIRKSISKTDTVMQKDFTLTPLTVNDDNHVCLAFGDIHIKNSMTRDAFYARYADAIMKHSLSPAYPLIHIQNVGDILTDRVQYNYLWQGLEEGFPVPTFNVIGNHDHNQNIANDDMKADDAFEDAFGPTYYSYNRGKVHYIALDDIWYEPSTSDPVQKSYKCPNIRPRQLEWLRRDIAQVPTDHVLVVSLHCPFSTNTGTLRNTYNIKEAMDVLVSRGHTVKVLSGHSHILYNNINLTSQGYPAMSEYCLATSCGAWYEDLFFDTQQSWYSISQDGTPAGYKVFKFNGTSLDWIYKSYYDTTAITTFVDQARVTNLQTSGTVKLRDETTMSHCILLNVWDWDPTWKVEWLNGSTWEGMTRFVAGAYDPVALDNFSSYGEVIRASLTYHLFYCTPPSYLSTFTYRVTNRFNKTELKTVTFLN